MSTAPISMVKPNRASPSFHPYILTFNQMMAATRKERYKKEEAFICLPLIRRRLKPILDQFGAEEEAENAGVTVGRHRIRRQSVPATQGPHVRVFVLPGLELIKRTQDISEVLLGAFGRINAIKSVATEFVIVIGRIHYLSRLDKDFGVQRSALGAGTWGE